MICFNIRPQIVKRKLERKASPTPSIILDLSLFSGELGFESSSPPGRLSLSMMLTASELTILHWNHSVFRGRRPIVRAGQDGLFGNKQQLSSRVATAKCHVGNIYSGGK